MKVSAKQNETKAILSFRTISSSTQDARFQFLGLKKQPYKGNLGWYYGSLFEGFSFWTESVPQVFLESCAPSPGPSCPAIASNSPVEPRHFSAFSNPSASTIVPHSGSDPWTRALQMEIPTELEKNTLNSLNRLKQTMAKQPFLILRHKMKIFSIGSSRSLGR